MGCQGTTDSSGPQEECVWKGSCEENEKVFLRLHTDPFPATCSDSPVKATVPEEAVHSALTL